jgi:hypothetical protein
MTNEALSELLGKEKLVRGYVYPYEGCRSEYWFEHSPSNIANFIMRHEDAREIILTDVLDRKILNTIGISSTAARIRNCCLKYWSISSPCRWAKRSRRSFPSPPTRKWKPGTKRKTRWKSVCRLAGTACGSNKNLWR